MTWLLLLALLLSGCVGLPAYEARDGADRSWSESWVVEQPRPGQRKCQLICNRYGSLTKCREYQC